jgi:hypothetical protein
MARSAAVTSTLACPLPIGNGVMDRPKRHPARPCQVWGGGYVEALGLWGADFDR